MFDEEETAFLGAIGGAQDDGVKTRSQAKQWWEGKGEDTKPHKTSMEQALSDFKSRLDEISLTETTRGTGARPKTQRKTQKDSDRVIADLKAQLKEATRLAEQALASEAALKQDLRRMKDDHKPEIMPSKTYDGSTELGDFLKNFDELAKLQKWPERRKRAILRNKLDGEALSVVSAEDCRTYDEMVEVLKSTFSTTDTSVFVMRLQSRIQAKGENFDHLARDIMKLGRKAYPFADEETLNEILKDIFLDAILDENLRAMVRFKDPDGLYEAAKMAEKVAAQSDREKKLLRKTMVKTAKVEDHDESTEFSQLCERLTKLEQQKGAPKKEQKKKPVKKGPPKCYGCGLIGHIRKYCPFDPSNVQMIGGFRPQLPPPTGFQPQENH